MSILRVIPFVLVIVCSGCIPYRLNQTPPVAGAVFKDKTKQPVSGAWLHYDGYAGHRIYVSKDGRFTFPVIYEWEMVPLGPLDRVGRRLLIVEARGYEPQCRLYDLWGAYTNQDFFLKPEKQPNTALEPTPTAP